MIKLSATVPFQHDTIYSPFAAAEFEEGLKWLKQDGFDGLEICITDPCTVDISKLKSKLKEFAMQVSTISTGQAAGIEGISLIEPDTVLRQRAIDRIKDHIVLAAQIDCPQVTIGLIRGVGSKDSGHDEQEKLADAVFRCATYGQKYGINLILEPLNKTESNLLTNVEETMRFIDQLQNPVNVGVLLDTYHSNMEDQGIEAAIARLKNKLFHVHFSDSNRGLPGSGCIDFQSVSAALLQVNFHGFVSLEVKNLPNKETVIKNGYQSMARYTGRGGNIN